MQSAYSTALADRTKWELRFIEIDTPSLEGNVEIPEQVPRLSTSLQKNKIFVKVMLQVI